MDCQVTVEEGILQGKECITFYGKKYYSFEGIPYAQPPVGKQRFSNPKPVKPWQGILDATKPGNKCIQANPYSATPIDGSEDCLYLNTYTPVLPHENKQKLPVLFFIHGGRLIFGHGHYYTPDYIIKNDVILVTINYRLHILGFLCLNIPECTGNMGLKDAALALKWVNKNIASFNGDGRNITVMGESAGAAIATSFLTSKMVENCFSKVISLSGTCISDLYIVDEDPVEKGRHIARLLGKDMSEPKEIYNFLLNAPIEDLVIAFTEAELSRPPSLIEAYFLPVVEEKFPNNTRFFTEHPTVSLKTNNFAKVPIIACMHSYEGAAFFGLNGEVNFIKDFHYLVPRFAKMDASKTKHVEKKILDFYLGEDPQNNDSKEEYLTMMSDVYFTRDLMWFAELVSMFWDQIYVLKFNYLGGMNTRVMAGLGLKGATHGDMIQYQFFRKNKAKNCSEKDMEIVDFLSESFANFMINGKPTWRRQKTKWLPYTNIEKRTLLVDNESISLQKDVDRQRLLFWIRLLTEHSKL